MKAHIDFETRSAVDLKKAGLHKYASDPSTDIMCLGFSFDDKAPVIHPVALPGETSYAFVELMDHVGADGLVVAHNSAFELAIWNSVGVKKYRWPKLHPEQIDCTMVRSYSMGLPGALDAAAAAVGIDARKDMKGQRLMLKMSQPKAEAIFCCQRPSCPNCEGKGMAYEWHQEPDQIERLFTYCLQDIVVERELDKRLLALSPSEKRLWILDQKINNRGVMLDVKAARRASEVVQYEQKRLDLEIREVSANRVASCRAHVQLKEWLKEEGVATKGVAKNDVIELLASKTLPENCRRALEIRQESAKSSTAKFEAMLNRVAFDDRLKGIFQFYGANTGRWAGRGIQPHNFPRQSLKQNLIDEAFKVLNSPMSVEKQRDYMEWFIGSPMRVLSECLRGFLVAEEGKELIAVDFSAIEARVLAWLANEIRKLEVFRTHGKIYEDAASGIFNVPIESIGKDSPERQIGKVSDLACGYQGGVGAFQAMAKGYGVKMAPSLRSLWDRASSEARDRSMSRWKSTGVKSGINKQEWIASELTKLAWREANRNIVDYWGNVEAAAIAAVRSPGTSFRVTPLTLPPVHFLVKGSFLFCKLPSGRNLCYPYPKLEEHKTPWDTKKEMLTYMTEDATIRKWIRAKTYGGSLVENITQAVARDILAAAMIRSEERFYPIVLHVHDEIVAEVAIGGGTVAELEAIVSEIPKWAHGLPMKAAGWVGKRYRK